MESLAGMMDPRMASNANGMISRAQKTRTTVSLLLASLPPYGPLVPLVVSMHMVLLTVRRWCKYSQLTQVTLYPLLGLQPSLVSFWQHRHAQHLTRITGTSPVQALSHAKVAPLLRRCPSTAMPTRPSSTTEVPNSGATYSSS